MITDYLTSGSSRCKTKRTNLSPASMAFFLEQLDSRIFLLPTLLDSCLIYNVVMKIPLRIRVHEVAHGTNVSCMSKGDLMLSRQSQQSKTLISESFGGRENIIIPFLTPIMTGPQKFLTFPCNVISFLLQGITRINGSPINVERNSPVKSQLEKRARTQT